MNFRKPNKESPDFRPSWQARLGTHSWQGTEDEGVARLNPRHESAKTTFRNDLLARGLLPNQLRYKQLRMHLPVKRVETETVITHVCHRAGTTRTNTPVHRPRTAVPQGNTSLQDRRVLPQGQDREKHEWPYSVDRCKISTFLAGAIRNTFVVRH